MSRNGEYILIYGKEPPEFPVRSLNNTYVCGFPSVVRYGNKKIIHVSGKVLAIFEMVNGNSPPFDNSKPTEPQERNAIEMDHVEKRKQAFESEVVSKKSKM